MNTFAFIIHPINPKKDVSRKYPLLGKLPRWTINLLSIFFPPVYISHIIGIKSTSTNKTLDGHFLACPLTPSLMMSIPTRIAYRKIIQTGQLAQKQGVNILGLGAFTSVVGDGGITIAQYLNIPVTTGDSYTVANAVQAINQAKNLLPSATKPIIAIVGAAGAIGSVCAKMLATQAQKIILIGNKVPLKFTQKQTVNFGCQNVEITSDINQLIKADLIVTVTNTVAPIVYPTHLKEGAIICDVARPRDVSVLVEKQRPDVLVIEGGLVAVPGNVDFGFDFGFPPKMAYACMSETMALALEKRFESYTLGKNLTLSQVLTIDRIASSHGFQLGGFRSFERALSTKRINLFKTQKQNHK